MSKNSRSYRSAFTLIELLVVIAIIGILSSMLFPSFARARENARRASCQSNLKQISMGFMQYTQDFDERMPMAWISTSVDNVAWNQVLQPYLKSTQVFQCPSDANANSTTTATWVTPGDPAFPKPFHTSYLYNYQMNGSSLAAQQNSSGTILMADGGVQGSATAPYTTTTSKSKSWLMWVVTNNQVNSTNEDWAAPNARHLGTGVVAFADGHVKSLRADKWYVDNSPWLDPAIGGP